MRNLLFVVCSTLFCCVSIAQNIELSSLLIAEDLKENANAVVRNSEIIVEIKDVDELEVRKKRTVTVFNKLGNKAVKAIQGYDNDQKIKRLSAVVYDALGNKIKKYSKSDFEDVSAVSGGTLYSDSRVKYLKYTPTSYPYTIVFECEYKNNSTAFIPVWSPMEGYNIAVENSSFQLLNPLDIPFQTRENNFTNYAIEKNNVTSNLKYTLTKQPAIKYEQRSIRLGESVPELSFALQKFSVKGTLGSSQNWKELGQWEYRTFYKNIDQISEATKAKVMELTKNKTSVEEKAKAIYEYVQNKTRYINVAIGIGGLKPATAEEVDRLGYGDCKGLTNYTRALLKSVGITSYFAEVFAGRVKQNMDYEFPKIQGNHVILNVPNDGKDIWLECTSQTMPFGFLGDFTDDREVLVITPEGGILKRTPNYRTNSLQNTNADIKLAANGNISASLVRKSYGIQYDDKSYIEKYTQEELDKHYKSNVWNYNNNLELTKSPKFTNDKNKVEFSEEVTINIEDFATVSPTNYIFKVNVLNRMDGIPKRYRNRKRPLKIRRAFSDKDVYNITLPDGFAIDMLPEKRNITNKFGNYQISFDKIDNNTIRYTREFSLQEGIFPKEDYKAYRKFFKSVAKLDNLRIELTKN